MKSENIEQILKKIGREDVPTEAHKIAEETSENFSKTLMPSRQHILWEHIMKSKITKLAAAAVIIIVVLIGIHQFGGSIDGSSVAFGEVVKKVEQIESFIFQHKMSIKGAAGLPEGTTVNLESVTYISQEYGIRRDMHMGEKTISIAYVPPTENIITEILPPAKKYVQASLTKEQLRKMHEESNPKGMIKEFMSFEHIKLGREIIDDVEVEGIEVDDPKFMAFMFENAKGRLWVDVETDLPVRIEIEGVSSGGTVETKIVAYDFDWDAELEPSVFEPNIPVDYAFHGEIDISSNEGAAIKGLRMFAELANGQYPSNLDIMTASLEAAEALRPRFADDSDRDPNMFLNKEELEKMTNIQAACNFYGKLVEDDKDVAYYGEKVTAEFPHAVLMRWKISEDQYRVIFGDLTTEDVSPDRLAELESMPLNLEPYAIKPQPADGTVGTPITEMELSWMQGAYVTEHKVYFGTNADSLSPLAEVPYSSLILAPALQRQMSYYWRVDEVQPDGSVVTGDVWSFNTGRMVAWWMLDDASGDIATDASDNGHDGKLVDNTSWVPGIIGGALQFDGDGDYVDIGNDPDLNITSQITVSAWIKVDAFDRDWQAIVTKGDSAWRLQRGKSNNHLEFACSGLVVPGTSWGNIFGTIDVNDGQWHHAVGVYDGQKLYLYVDGTLDVSADASGTIRINEEPVYISENSERPERCWNGLIDDVRIYSYALSADEIAAIYEAAIEAK